MASAQREIFFDARTLPTVTRHPVPCSVVISVPHMAPLGPPAITDRGTPRGSMPMSSVRSHVLIIVQNLPVPLDRRVWLECQALTAAGYRGQRDLPEGPGGSISPGDRRRPDLQVPARTRGQGLPGYAIEFGYSLAADRVAVHRVWRHTVPGHPGLQPTGHLLAAGPALAARQVSSSSSTSTTSTPSSSSPDSASHSLRQRVAVQRAAVAWSG